MDMHMHMHISVPSSALARLPRPRAAKSSSLARPSGSASPPRESGERAGCRAASRKNPVSAKNEHAPA
eukprot:scaffold57888_cov57-Phaeocystis_antarctica.AAC.3